ncbi:PepSY domain-containing protein [Methylopila sp. M107]|uniref:PepSY domain-containing protein n=1 Tax=Methylopila sp. M107 TaxID=1101190 RepID=UPI0003660932|nr:PepSY domain-containing protein [Methylopila sp. M107]
MTHASRISPTRTFAALSLAAALGLASAAPALADRPGADWLPIDQAIEKLKAAGYTAVSELEADDGRWEGKGVKDGKTLEFHLDPKTGAISNEHLDD